MNRKVVTAIFALSAMFALSALAQAQSNTGKRAGLTNPSFEKPEIEKGSFNFVEKIPGWQTTDQVFEVWGTGFGGVEALDGNQFVELNAKIDGTLYQDSAGIEQDAVVEFTFAHRGRNGDDTMELSITDLGSDNLIDTADDTVLYSKQYTTGKSDWVVYNSTTEPAIRALGNTVRFAYIAIQGTGGDGPDKTEGNFLDAADFGVGVVTDSAPKPSGTVVAWGDNDKGQTDVPEGLTGVVKLAAGGWHTLALKQDGTVVAWGYNHKGQATVPEGLTDVTAIAAGAAHSLALKQDGTVVAWGYNEGDQKLPEGLTNVTAIAVSHSHTLALKQDGTVVAWGYNGYKQATVPEGLTDVTAVGGGWEHSVALKRDGTVVAWGRNDSGQVTVPEGLSNVTAISAASGNNLALQQDGMVVAWGFNGYSKVSEVPKGLSDVTAISSGSSYNLALKQDGTVVAWGSLRDGNLKVPKGLGGVIAIAAGSDHSVALVPSNDQGGAADTISLAQLEYGTTWSGEFHWVADPERGIEQRENSAKLTLLDKNTVRYWYDGNLFGDFELQKNQSEKNVAWITLKDKNRIRFKWNDSHAVHAEFWYANDDVTTQVARTTAMLHTAKRAPFYITLDQTYHIQVPGQDLFMAFRNSEKAADKTPAVVLAGKSQLGDADDQFTMLKVRQVTEEFQENSYLVFEVANFPSPTEKKQWLTIRDQNNLIIHPYPETAKKGRSYFLTGKHTSNSDHTFFEAMWVNHNASASRAKIAHEDHHYFLTNNNGAGEPVFSRDLKNESQAKQDSSTQWELVSTVPPATLDQVKQMLIGKWKVNIDETETLFGELDDELVHNGMFMEFSTDGLTVSSKVKELQSFPSFDVKGPTADQHFQVAVSENEKEYVEDLEFLNKDRFIFMFDGTGGQHVVFDRDSGDSEAAEKFTLPVAKKILIGKWKANLDKTVERFGEEVELDPNFGRVLADGFTMEISTDGIEIRFGDSVQKFPPYIVTGPTVDDHFRVTVRHDDGVEHNEDLLILDPDHFIIKFDFDIPHHIVFDRDSGSR